MMTKEELEKESEEWLDKRYLKDMGVRNPCKRAYLASAELREKQLMALEAQLSLKIVGCIKAHLCKQDADYDEPIISPKFL